jgi:hypothetical protein
MAELFAQALVLTGSAFVAHLDRALRHPATVMGWDDWLDLPQVMAVSSRRQANALSPPRLSHVSPLPLLSLLSQLGASPESAWRVSVLSLLAYGAYTDYKGAWPASDGGAAFVPSTAAERVRVRARAFF